jgi:hypothetical protein
LAPVLRPAVLVAVLARLPGPRSVRVRLPAPDRAGDEFDVLVDERAGRFAALVMLRPVEVFEEFPLSRNAYRRLIKS